MVDDLIAITALADIALTAVLVICLRRKPFPYREVFVGLALAAVFGSIIFPVYASRGGGGPVHLLVITYSCFGIACFFPLARRTWNLVLFFFTLGMAFALPGFAVGLHGYTFTSYKYTRLRDSLSLYLEGGLPDQGQSFPAGWLADQPFAVDFPRSSMTGWTSIPHPLWHSRFSGIYQREVIHGEAWYPGGPLKDVRQKIEIRER
ncbi:MAG: hypothetical protein ACYC6A_04830 [Armatimonadota bacterium]